MFDHLVGQEHIKELLEITIKAASQENRRLPDMLFSGPGGVGKSTFAGSIASFTKSEFVVISAGSVSSLEELINYTVLNKGIDVIPLREFKEIYLPKIIYFIDEAHKMKEPLKTELLTALEGNRRVTFPLKKTDEIFTVDFNEATVIIATTDKNDLSGPLLTRFNTFELKPYSDEEIAGMIHGSKKWDFDICLEISKRCKNIMRTGVYEMQRVQDYLNVKQVPLTKKTIDDYYSRLRHLDDIGLDHVDYSILKILNNSKYAVGIRTLSSRLSKNIKEIEEREAFMATKELLEKTSKGRIITERGKEKVLQFVDI